jgi:hypothetical protein
VPAPAPITAATGGLNLDWRGEPIANPDRRHLVPVVELHPSGATSSPVLIPVHELDSVVGELDDDFDFGLGQYIVENPGFNFQAPKLTMPKLSFSIGQGKYTPLKPAAKPTTKAPVRAAIRKVIAAKKKPIVIARKKPEQLNSARTASLAQIYAELQKQRKIVNLLATKKQVSAEHKRKMSDDDFRDVVMSLLRKIEKQCSGDTSGNYFARWNRLKAVTGVNVHERK